MLSIDQRQELVSAIDSVENEVTEIIVAEILRNPFWDARFGERGVKFIRQDSAHNIQHLVTAISSDNPDSLYEYYRWLRGLLVYRGMCTLHLRDTLDLYGRELSSRLPIEWPLIEIYHKASYKGLAYDHPTSLLITEKEFELAIAITNHMFSSKHIQSLLPCSHNLSLCLRDVRFILSYLADAVQVQQPDLFEKHVSFLAGYFPSIGGTVEYLVEALRVTADDISLCLPSEMAGEALVVLSRALAHSLAIR